MTPRIVGALRVKNEARWIERCLRSILPICSRVHVLDDGSADDTVAIASSLPRVSVHPMVEDATDEVRDKNCLLGMVDRAGGADWIVMIDGDEVLDASPADYTRLVASMTSGRVGCISLPILYLWDREDQVRVDGVYGQFRRESIFRYRGERFQRTSAGANFHCGNAPQALRRNRAYVEIPLLHFGYLHREDRIRKYEWYNRTDPNNQTEVRYRHMVQGDVPDVPATMTRGPLINQLRHAGPLTLRPLFQVLPAAANYLQY